MLQKVKNTNPLVSVLMPAFNTEKYIGEAIESILKQSYQNFELLILDDGSTDKTKTIIEQYHDNRIQQLLFEKNQGLVSARNHLVRVAKGKYIALMDSDDISMSNRLEIQVNFLESNEADICGSELFCLCQNSGKIKPSKKIKYRNSDIRAFLTIACPITVIMAKAELFKQHLYAMEDISAEDYGLWIRLALAGCRFTNIKQKLMSYRIHSTQTSSVTKKIETNEGFLRNQRNYLQGLNIPLNLTPASMPLCRRLKDGTAFIRFLNEKIPGISIPTNYDIYAQFQYRGNGIYTPFIRLERFIISWWGSKIIGIKNSTSPEDIYPSKLDQLLKKRWRKTVNSTNKLVFNLLFNSETKKKHKEIITNAEQALSHMAIYESKVAYQDSEDPLVLQAIKFKTALESTFKNRLLNKTKDRVLFQIPNPLCSPGGYSVLQNLSECLSYLGVPVAYFDWNHNSIQKKLDGFSPTIFISTGSPEEIARIDWTQIERYKQKNALLIGFNATITEYENSPLEPRLEWAKENSIDFFYSYRDPDYVNTRTEYKAFFNAGYQIVYTPFGANILHYYPVPGFKRDINYVIMATRKREHITYMKNIARKYSGFVDGPNWNQIKNFNFNRDRDRYIYARAKVGLNVHLTGQLDWACEVNERTYQLAACGVPQLTDHPKLIDKIFSREALFIADSSAEYDRLFEELMLNPELGLKRALIAQKEVFEKHTTFHRAEAFMDQMETLFPTRII